KRQEIYDFFGDIWSYNWLASSRYNIDSAFSRHLAPSETRSVILSGLRLYSLTRSKALIDEAHRKGISISYYRILCSAIFDKARELKTACGTYIPFNLIASCPTVYHFDNFDMGKEFHGSLELSIQAGGSTGKPIGIEFLNQLLGEDEPQDAEQDEDRLENELDRSLAEIGDYFVTSSPGSPSIELFSLKPGLPVCRRVDFDLKFRSAVSLFGEWLETGFHSSKHFLDFFYQEENQSPKASVIGYCPLSPEKPTFEKIMS
ncbi:hypothetical protein Ciccas_014413, partial [Cichlidogyrus casuarinus]